MTNVFDMSDEEFAKLGTTALEDQVPPPPVEEPEEEPIEEELPGEEPEEEPQDDAEEPIEEEDGDEAAEEPVADPVPSQSAQKPFGEKPGEEPTEGEGVSDSEEQPIDYEAAYKQIMAPFKANGKMIQAQNIEEVISLMQMGANYTKKMQALQPHRAMLVMLEQNELDAEKLSFLIDLDKKNPQAIQKFLKDADIDPLDIDTDAEPSYQGGQHVVSDQEALVLEHVRELQTLPDGNELLQSIRGDAWDEVSRRMIFNNPGILYDLHFHYQHGAYQRVAEEVERLRAMGQIGPEIPFFTAYQHVGNTMDAQGAFADLASTSAPKQTRTPVATRTRKPASQQADNQRVRAAAPPRSTVKTAQSEINPLAMSDEEFLKKFRGRL